MNWQTAQKQKYLTLVFTDTTLRIIKLDRSGRQLVKLADIALPPQTIIHGEVADPTKLGQFLRQLRLKNNLQDQFVIVGLPENKISIHTLELPGIKISEIDEAIRLQAENLLPFDYDEEYLDWQLVNAAGGEEKTRIMLMAVPRRIIDNFVTSLEAAEWQPIAFETISLALWRLLPQEKVSFAALVENNHNVLILNRDQSIIAASVFAAADQLVETMTQMSQFYAVSPDEAKQKIKVYLCGQAVNNALISQIKNHALFAPVLLKTGVTGLPPDRQTALAWLVAMAQKKVTPPRDKNSLNILPISLAQKYQQLSTQKREQNFAWLFGFGLLCLNLILAFVFWQTNNQKISLKKQTQAMANPSTQAAALAGLQQIDFVANTVGTNQGVEQLLTMILANRPGVTISGVSFDKQTREINLTGHFQQQSQLLQLKEELEKNPALQRVLLPLSSLEKETNADFSLIAILKNEF